MEFGYQGLPRDPETGLVYFRNRYYDPELGRFISADPKGYTDGPSEYAFEMDDPANGSDPLGFANMTSAPAAVPDLDFERMKRDAKAVQKVLANPRVQGGLKVVGAGVEFAAGVGAASTPTGVGQVVGVVAMTHAVDTGATGLRQIISGKPEQSSTSQAIEGVARLAGAKPQTAHQIGETTDATLGVGLTAGAGAAANGVRTAGLAPNGAATSNLVDVDPRTLRWSQTTAGSGGRAAELRVGMREHGWVGDPIDVVRTEHGLVTVDHTRAAVAMEQGMSKIPARVHLPNEPLPESMLSRPWNRAGDKAKTWGEAVALRGMGQTPPIGPTGSPVPPRLPPD